MPTVRALRALTITAIVAAALPAAAADDPSALSTKVDQAIATAASYRISVAASGGLALEILTVGRDRVRVQSNAGGTPSESVVVGAAMYYHGGGNPWVASAIPAVKRPRKNLLYMGAPDTQLQPLADRTEDGVTYGAFGALAVGNVGVPATMECTYDKRTYRPHACTVLLQAVPTPVQVTYDRWNDPANVVEAPPGVSPPTPAPPAKPAPSPSH